MWERWSEGARKGESRIGKEVRSQVRREKEREDGRSEGGKVGREEGGRTEVEIWSRREQLRVSTAIF